MASSQLENKLSSFIVRIRRYLQEPDASISHWDDPTLKHLFNSNYRKRTTELHMAFEGYFTVIGTRDLVKDQGRYAWPDGFHRLMKMELVRTDGRTVPIDRFERHKHVKHNSNAGGDDYFPTYRPVGSGFVLEPAPDQTVENGLQLEWVGIPEELTDDNDGLHSDFPQMYSELLVLDTAVAAFDLEGMQEEGAVRTLLRQRAEWEERWERYIDNRLISTQQVVPFVPSYFDS